MSAHGHGADVENTIWMRAVLIGTIFLVIGVLAYGVMGVGVANIKHHDYEEAHHDYEVAKEDYKAASDSGTATQSDLDQLHKVEEEAHHHYVEAHLSYLTWRTAGITILLMCVVYALFIGLGGFMNSIQPSGDHGDSHGHEDEYGHEHHGSSSPIIFALGIMLFLMGFPMFADAAKAMLMTDAGGNVGDMMLSLFGLVIVAIGVANWWREDLPFNGYGEQIATSHPFEGQHIRKAGIWVFIMSEVMVFATFFSSYLRMRTEWCTFWQVQAENPSCQVVGENGAVSYQVDMLTASDFLRPNGGSMVLDDGTVIGGQGDFMTLLPGAINTFALIISSYTIVLALKTAKAHNWEAPKGFMGKIMPTQKVAVRNYLIATFLLGSMFIVLKLIEWSHLVAEGFDIGTQGGSIFYIATGAHGLHVFIGLLVMLYLIFKADTVGFDEENGQGIEYFGLYWHFVDLAWVAIFPAFYLY